MGESKELSATEDAEDGYTWMNPISASHKNIKMDKKRRFTEEQVKSLELMFETQTKLEPRQKLQLAKELHLHPKQVSIWFQNKRARWKSKQLEREYSTLRADYDVLLSSFESQKNEKQVLNKQLKTLVELLDKPMEERGEDSDHIKVDEDERSNLPKISSKRTEMRPMTSSDDEENQYSKLSEKAAALFGDTPPGSSVIQFEQQFCSHPSDQTCAAAPSQWWEFWPVNE